MNHTEVLCVQDEVEMDGRVVEQKGRMTAVAVEIRKKESGELVAIRRQWMTTSRPKCVAAHSKI
jgi:acyl-coenzyme A thioesterase 13